MNQYVMSTAEVMRRAGVVAAHMRKDFPNTLHLPVYGVPRGGTSAALALRAVAGEWVTLVDNPAEAWAIVDDLIDNGSTQQRYALQAPQKIFYALANKQTDDKLRGRWVVFPWEQGDRDASADDFTVRLLQYVGEDPKRGGLLDTPQRVAKAWQHWCKGYRQDPADVLKTFEDGAEGTDQMVLVNDIPFYSHCEHHLAPFFGTACIGYIPDGRIVGLSKLSRLLEVYACRLQVQERLTNNVADALYEHLRPHGVGVIIRARHMCMESRGVRQQGHHTVTSALRGAIKSNSTARAEFLRLSTTK